MATGSQPPPPTLLAPITLRCLRRHLSRRSEARLVPSFRALTCALELPQTSLADRRNVCWQNSSNPPASSKHRVCVAQKKARTLGRVAQLQETKSQKYTRHVFPADSPWEHRGHKTPTNPAQVSASSHNHPQSRQVLNCYILKQTHCSCRMFGLLHSTAPHLPYCAETKCSNDVFEL